MAEGSDWAGRRKQGLSFEFVFAVAFFVIVVKKSQIFFHCLRNFLSDTETSEVSPSVPAPVYPTLPLRWGKIR